MPNPNLVIALRLSALGDVCMALPAIKQVLLDNPGLSVVLVTKFDLRRLVEDERRLIIYPVDVKNEFRGIIGTFKLFLQLRRQFGSASVADLHHVIRTRILNTLFRMAGKKVETLQKGRREKSRLASKHDKVFEQLPTSFERYLNVFTKLGYHVSKFTDLPTFSIKSNLHPQKQSFLSKTRPVWVGVAPFAAHESKIYPFNKMETLVGALNESDENQIFLFGSQEESLVLDLTTLRYPGVISLAGWALEDQLTVISKLDVMVSMDSANMHLASLFGVPVVSIWGATHPFAGFMGNNQPMEYTVQLDMPCRPCSIYGNKPCWRGDHACLRNIDPMIVLEKVSSVLKAHK